MAGLYWDKALYISYRDIYTGGAVSFEKEAFAWDCYFDERKKIIAAFCGLWECDFFFLILSLIIYRYDAVFARLHGEMMGVANCRGLLLGNNFLFFFACMIMMGRAVDEANCVADRIHTA